MLRLIFILILVSFVTFIFAQNRELGNSPCVAAIQNVSNAPCGSSSIESYSSNYIDDGFNDHLPGQSNCSSEEEPFDGWVTFTAISEVTGIVWQGRSSNNYSLYLYKEVSNCNELEFMFCDDEEFSTAKNYEWSAFGTNPGTTYYIRIKKVKQGSSSLTVLDGRLCIYTAPISKLCGSCESASCNIDGPFPDVTSATDFADILDCDEQNPSVCNISCEVDGPIMIKTCHKVMTSNSGTLGIVRQVNTNSACLDVASFNNVSQTATAEVFYPGNCSEPTYRQNKTVYGERFISEWYDLMPNTEVVVCIYHAVQSTACFFNFQCPRYYFPDPMNDCPALSLNIGDACDDGDASTINDMVLSDCTCQGEIEFDCPALGLNIGDTCDDGDENTTGDRIQPNCICEGINPQSVDCPALGLNIGNLCDDGDDATFDDTVESDCTCAGVTYDCPDLQLNIGDECNGGGNTATIPIVQPDCTCGDTKDCLNLELNFGDPCDDNDDSTINDIVQNDCSCSGVAMELIECDFLELNIGDVCDDGNTQTFNDRVLSDCRCQGEKINIFVPNAISVNEDGINDKLEIFTNTEVESFNLKIFNKWGTLIFESEDINNMWDGKFRGEHVNTGTYFYVLSLNNITKNGEFIVLF